MHSLFLRCFLNFIDARFNHWFIEQLLFQDAILTVSDVFPAKTMTSFQRPFPASYDMNYDISRQVTT